MCVNLEDTAAKRWRAPAEAEAEEGENTSR